MTKHLLSKLHGFSGQEQYTEEMVICSDHLREMLNRKPLRENERVTDADADLQCEFCWPGSCESGAL